jgi:hypothetical protein
MHHPSWLFICARHPDTTQHLGGGEVLSVCNLTALRQHADVEIFSLMNWEGFFERVLRFLFLSLDYTSSLYPWKVSRLKQILRSRKFDGVFIDQSFYGRLAQEIKNDFPDLKVITQFHNVESMAAITNLPVPIWLRKIISRVAFKNESLAVQFSDCCLFLTSEDLKDVSELNGPPQRPQVLPLILPPTFLPGDKNQKTGFDVAPNDRPYLLFCGSYFLPNTQGISWFIEKVLPHIPYDLHIVGFGMEKFKGTHPKVKNWGTVRELAPHYKNALGVVAPIFIPGGMKTKTVEALHYRKILFGTQYALLGIPNEICLPIQGAEGFIRAILQADFSVTTPGLGKEFSFEHKKQVFERILGKV